MPNDKQCPFCQRSGLRWRSIRENDLFASIVSMPWFRPGHCLVIPKRHITTLAELNADEAAAVMMEAGRLSVLLDEGHGTGMMQKYQPGRPDNGIKVSHLHIHVFPRFAADEEPGAGLFPVPQPNDFPGFVTPSEDEVMSLLERLR